MPLNPSLYSGSSLWAQQIQHLKSEVSFRLFASRVPLDFFPLRFLREYWNDDPAKADCDQENESIL